MYKDILPKDIWNLAELLWQSTNIETRLEDMQPYIQRDILCHLARFMRQTYSLDARAMNIFSDIGIAAFHMPEGFVLIDDDKYCVSCNVRIDPEKHRSRLCVDCAGEPLDTLDLKFSDDILE